MGRFHTHDYLIPTISCKKFTTFLAEKDASRSNGSIHHWLIYLLFVVNIKSPSTKQEECSKHGFLLILV